MNAKYVSEKELQSCIYQHPLQKATGYVKNRQKEDYVGVYKCLSCGQKINVSECYLTCTAGCLQFACQSCSGQVEKLRVSQSEDCTVASDKDIAKQDETLYTAEYFLDRWKGKDSTFYLVKWEGYDICHSTWEPPTELNAEMMTEFDKSDGATKTDKKKRNDQKEKTEPAWQ